MSSAVKMMIAVSALIFLFCTLTDAKMQIISSKPDVKVSEDSLILCKAGGEGEISWQKDGHDIEEEHMEVDKVDESTSKLIIKAAQLADSGTYTCVCEFDSGHNDEISTNIYVYEPIKFHQTTDYHEFLLADTVLVPCIVTGKPEVDVTWYRNGQSVGSDVKNRFVILPDKSLQIRKIERDDEGSYSCKATITGRPVSDMRNISVVVNAPPTVKIHEEVKRVLAGPEMTVTMTCLVSGAPQPVISWTFPITADLSQFQYNSDKSELKINTVDRRFNGEYICTAKNKISEKSATIMLDVSEHPLVVLSQNETQVEPGGRVIVSCSVSGHPTPTFQWIRKSPNLKMTSNRTTVVESDLIIENVIPSDGGIYSCVAESSAGSASNDFILQTWPDKPTQVTVKPGAAAANFFLDVPVVNGGSNVTAYVLQWRQRPDQSWSEKVVLADEPLVAAPLLPYTSYFVRVAAQNSIGQGVFSKDYTIHTLGEREPDRPFLTSDDIKLEENTFSIPFKQQDTGGSPIIHYVIRYRPNREDEEWRERELPSNATNVFLHDLHYKTEYHVELFSVNRKGRSNPAAFNFTTLMATADGRKSGIGKGGVVGIVMLIFLVLLIAVDATCCYTNHCGMLMYLAVKLFGRKTPGAKSMEEGEGTISNIDVKLNGLATPRGSIPKQQTQNGAQNMVQSEVTCDKAPLTKFEKSPANGNPVTDP
ncbi:neural cell adhesion molecule 1 isoform X1 [Denticeps clupeoides]|uniref:neural cell adhesion molecule 1 isoform X1 n=1 Tax=Denticeps clupeoides TaxID=299321 RepID=UPI0010A49D5E|nr:neural cell adhesion molecule 1-like isoform X1 [Denticeps clupeoides]